jgi:hypothetical protein
MLKTLLRSRLVIALAIVAGLVGLYALLGFKLAPRLVRSQAIEFVRTTYGRELEIGEVRVQPFKLQLEVRDLLFPDADGQAMLGFERLFVDFELSSLWKRAYYFRDVELSAPLVRAVVRPPGDMNLADLAVEEKPGEAATAEEEPLPSVWIARFNVDRGVVDFLDQARRQPFERRFSPVEFTLNEFRTTPEGGEFHLTAQSEAAEKFDWKGRFALAPTVSSTGDFSIADLRAVGVGEFLAEALPFTITNGTIDGNGRYQFSLGQTTHLDVELPTIAVAGLTLRAHGESADWVTIPTLTVAGTRATMPQQAVTIGRIDVRNLSAGTWRDADGSINLSRLFAPGEATTASTPAGPKTAGASSATASSAGSGNDPDDWTLELAELDVVDASIAFEDRSLQPTLKTVLAPTHVKVSKVSLDLSRPLAIELSTKIDGEASFAGAGELTPEPLQAALDVTLDGIDLRRLQPYAAGTTDLTIHSGKAATRGRFELNPPGGPQPEVVYAGDATIARLRTTDNALDEDFFNFDKLELRKLRYAMTPDALAIDRVLLTRPFARIINSSDQVLNVAAVLDPEGTKAALEERKRSAAAEAAKDTGKVRGRKQQPKKQATKKEPTRTAEPPPVLAETGMPIRVREVRIVGGRMDFADYFIEPNFEADIQSLEGTVTGVSTDPNAHAKIDLKGQVGEFSPVTIAGEIQPFAYDRFTDVGLKFENISLPVFNPYSGRFAGFNIAKGKLTTDLRYEIVNRKLDAKHHIRIDQLEWGEATASKEAVPLPIKFATSLLKDVNGVIDLDVPVTGTLDDPKFRVGPIVWKIIKNILVKAVTAPFRLLGSLFKGAEDAQFVEFPPGDPTLDPVAAEKLGTLAKGLAQKPELKLDIPIGAVTELDQPALVQRRYDVELEAAKKRVLKRKATRDGEPVPFAALDAGDQIDVLEDLVQKLSGKPAELPKTTERPEGVSRKEAKELAAQATVFALQTQARHAIKVTEADIDSLSTARAEAVQAALLSSGELDPTRVFMARSDKVTAQEGKVRLELSLK